MAYRLLYFDEVIQEVQEAKVWYKEKREGLEIEFALAVETAIQRIQRMPAAYSIRYKNVRLAYTKVFPYAIHFYINEKEKIVAITAIVHKKRHPSVAQGRV